MDGLHWLVAWIVHPLPLVGVGSAAGGIARYLVSRGVAGLPWTGHFPWGTFLVNTTGSLILGVLAASLYDPRGIPAHRHLYLLAGTGFCGGFTTFSTYELELHKLLLEGRWGLALLYAAGSLACGLAGVATGVWLGRRVFGP